MKIPSLHSPLLYRHERASLDTRVGSNIGMPVLCRGYTRSYFLNDKNWIWKGQMESKITIEGIPENVFHHSGYLKANT